MQTVLSTANAHGLHNIDVEWQPAVPDYYRIYNVNLKPAHTRTQCERGMFCK